MILDQLTDKIQGKVEKLRIKAFDNEKDAESDVPVSDDRIYRALINPETYNRDYKLCFNDEGQASGTSSVPVKFNKICPEELTFDFLFDDTGIIDGDLRQAFKLPANQGVMDEIDKFRNILIKYEGEIHQPRFVRLNWGKLDFIGRAEDIRITFKLFAPGGIPIRAVAKVRFRSIESEQKRAAREKRSSPDLSHILRVKAGDTLPIMCKKVYGDPKYYLQVAEANGLGNFRRLETGMDIVFPPIDKTTS